MIGFLVKHGSFGLGRVEAAHGERIRVCFFISGQTVEFAGQRTSIGLVPVGICRFPIGLETVCQTDSGNCRIKSRKFRAGWTGSNTYSVEFEDGRLDEMHEEALTPTESAPNTLSPLETLLQLRQEGIGVFERRQMLLTCYLKMLRGALGVRALLSSRIDLRPHQAYVAGVVLLDRQQRYVLADEVGLGKTIEAGIVIHDLLSRKSNARILILCPGSLTQQWLCEIYAKFCGRVFCMPELDGGGARATTAAPQFILSFIGAKERQTELLSAPWDLIVIDEVHHLLALPALYALVHKLSQAANGLLLLSALPAQHREDEYLRLLSLLDPENYKPKKRGIAKQFRELYAGQRKLGVLLRWVSSKLVEVATGERKPATLIKKLLDLTTWPVIDQDEKLRVMIGNLNELAPTFARDVHAVLHHVGDTHRINRRILRNRRARLIAQGEVPNIERKLNRLAYKADQFELDALNFVRRLLTQLRRAGLDDGILVPLARLLFHAGSDANVLAELLQLAVGAQNLSIDADEESFALDSILGYAGWRGQAAALWHKAWFVLDEDALRETLAAANRWREVEDSRNRTHTLLQFLRARHHNESGVKFLVFAGYPGLAEKLFRCLRAELPGNSVARFYFGMSDGEKEEEVRQFRRDAQRWVLVSDETGGEGRNFQFVDEVIHFDTPWHAARIEQRIGRLDRLGRERTDVISHVIYCKGVEEESWVKCLAQGLKVFSCSISGLEFALREIEKRLVIAAIDEGPDGLGAMVPELKAAVLEERAEDQSAEVLDEASFERVVADDFRRAQSSREKEKALEFAFCQYFKTLAGPDALRFCRDKDYAEGIVSFQPEDVSDVSMDAVKDTHGRLGERRGTFFRAIAQVRPDLEFFSAGNVFFDAICESLFSVPKGRAYAVECHLPQFNEWRGFEFIFRVTGERKAVLGKTGLLNQLDRIFAHRIEHVWVREDGELAKFPDKLLQIRSSLRGQAENQTWWNLIEEHTQTIEACYANLGWSILVQERLKQAQDRARERFGEVLTEKLQPEHARLDEQERQLHALKPAGWKDAIADMKSLRSALDGWQIELDSLGFLSVNGGLIQR